MFTNNVSMFRMFFKQFLRSLRISPPFRPFSSNINSFTCRTHTCGELREKHVGEQVTLCGWVQYQRCDKFAVLKDAYGIIQIFFDDHDIINKNFVLSLPLESVIQITGDVKRRPSNKSNKKMPTGDVEVFARKIKLLNPSISQLPFTTRDYENVQEPTKQKFRYLSLRMTTSQIILRARSQLLMKIREYLHNLHGFVDVETPTLFRRTPGGAKEFVVPTKFPGQFYSLVQSPQQFKQLLMVGAMDRYFQIARCYRNEGTKSDRQPEFTQVDIEASFTSAEQIRELVEGLLVHSWPPDKPEIRIPFPCISYEDAMDLYGTDKPDIRFDMKLCNVTDLFIGLGIEIFDAVLVNSDCIMAIAVPKGLRNIKKPKLKELQDKAVEFGIPNLIPIGIKEEFKWDSFLNKRVPKEVQMIVNERLKARPNDLILLAAGKKESVGSLLGKIRIECAQLLNSAGVEVYSKSGPFSFVWVTDFPLFFKDDSGILESAHHPFTAPHPDDSDNIYTDPLNVRSLHYDLVLNGQEVAGGSIRIHDAALQEHILSDILKVPTITWSVQGALLTMPNNNPFTVIYSLY